MLPAAVTAARADLGCRAWSSLGAEPWIGGQGKREVALAEGCDLPPAVAVEHPVHRGVEVALPEKQLILLTLSLHPY